MPSYQFATFPFFKDFLNIVVESKSKQEKNGDLLWVSKKFGWDSMLCNTPYSCGFLWCVYVYACELNNMF